MSLSRSRRIDSPPKVEINIVPLVDVALVLLIIFMVTATFVKTSALQLRLPPAPSRPSQPAEGHDPTIEIDRAGAFAFNGAPVSEAALARALTAEAAAHGSQTPLIIRGDRRAAYGQVVKAMSLAQAAGFTRLSVATQAPEDTDDAPR